MVVKYYMRPWAAGMNIKSFVFNFIILVILSKCIFDNTNFAIKLEIITHYLKYYYTNYSYYIKILGKSSIRLFVRISKILKRRLERLFFFYRSFRNQKKKNKEWSNRRSRIEYNYAVITQNVNETEWAFQNILILPTRLRIIILTCFFFLL